MTDDTAQVALRTTRRLPFRLNYLGLVGAVLATVMALTPSLLPRPWPFEGAIAGFGAALGYGLGSLLSWGLRSLWTPKLSARTRQIAWLGLAILGPLLFLGGVIAGGHWQNQVRQLVGQKPIESTYVLGVAVIILIIATSTILFFRMIRAITRWVIRLLGRFIPVRLATAGGVILVSLLAYWLAAGVVFNTFISAADRIYAGSVDETSPGVVAPTSAQRTGGPGSLVAWNSLGREGRNFVARGPSTAQLTAFSGKPSLEPIRVYVGLSGAATARDRAELALRELMRTGAFDRKVLVVAGATGTGWLEPQSVNSIEYLWNGNTAIATIQYSYLPSWISILVDKDRATDAGQELFEAVYSHWKTLPEQSRPKLISYGLSLGSFAAQSAFGSASDIAARTDGALYLGTPNFTEPWGNIAAGRDAGSPIWQPTYRGGETVRFGASVEDLAKPGGNWPSPHIVFMQHASDPVVWWSPDLLTRKPDWLAERRGPDVSADTRWYPFISFLQVTVDQFFGVSVPAGHGHNYGNTIVGAWQNVVPAPDMTPDSLARLQTLIDTMPIE